MNFILTNDLLTLTLHLDPTTLAGMCLWSLALYLSFASLREGVTHQLERGLEKIYHFWRQKPEQGFPQSSVMLLWASLLSIFPFLGIGFLCNYGVEISLGRSWAVSLGILACMGCGVYELGRRSQ